MPLRGRAALLLLALTLHPARAIAAGVSDTEARKAFDQIQSAFVDLDRAVSAPSPGEVALGRQLFFDPRLSGNRAMSCATCHNPGLAWADGLPRARGLHHDELARNTPSLFNVNRNIPFLYFWDGRADTLEQAATTALRSRLEMNRDPEKLIAELNRVPDYARAFYQVYGYPGLTETSAIRAIAAFIRTEIRAEQTPFDRFERDPSALDQAQRRGMLVFTGKGRCMQCHNGPFFSDDFFHNIGLKPTPGLADLGRFEVTKLKANRRAFRTPPLRNAARTAPYMHDGSLASLRDVIEFYSRGGDVAEDRDPEMRRLDLTEGEKADLLAFLESLSSPASEVLNPVLPESGPPRTLEAAVKLQKIRLALLKTAVERGDRAVAASMAGALRGDAADRAPLLAADGATAPACLQAMSARASELESLALSSGSVKAMTAGLRALESACEQCSRAPVPGAITPVPPVLPLSTAPAAGCASPPPLSEVLAAVGRAGPGQPRLAALKERAFGDLLKVHRFRAIIEHDPAACDGLRGLNDEYKGKVRPADQLCREWNRNDELQRAMITRAPDLPRRCRDFLGQPHDDGALPPKDAEAACAILVADRDDPAAACRKLTPKYLGEMKAGTCENMLRRLAPGAKASACDAMKNLPGDQYERCVDLSAFARAWKAKDPAQCGDREFCRAFMGERAGSAGRAEARARAAACGALDEPGARPAEGCLPDFTVDRFVRDLDGGKWDAKTATRLRDTTVRDVLFYYEFRTLLDGKPDRCAELKGYNKTYAGVVRPGDEVCRERFYEDRLQSGLIARSPDLEADCRQSLLHSYEYVHMDPEDARAACAILVANVDDPKAACGKLVPRYLGEMKLTSCENIILRLKPGQDPAICGNLENQPKDWMGRCLGLSAFNNAFWKKDAALCRTDELCRALMGDEAASAGRAAYRVHTLACNALRARD